MDLPLIGTPQQFRALHDCLVRAGYTEPAIFQALDLKDMERLDLALMTHAMAKQVADAQPLHILIRLFLVGVYVSVAEIESQLPGEAWAAMNALGLIADHPSDTKLCSAKYALYPVGGIYILSDRWNNADGTPKGSFPDIVYPALTKSTREFLLFLPEEPCDAFLEICAGTGIAAVQSARVARESVAADIAPRSAHFALFNAALNHVTNFRSLVGDLYAPVQGQTFDRISAHPPYMPVLRQSEIYYGGGEDGEEITRRVIAELPAYLRPGGRAYCRTLGTDRPGATFEQRVRSWLGNVQSEFDVALFITKNVDPAQFAIESAVRRARGLTELDEWKNLFERHQIKEILTGTVVLQRIAEPRPVFTIRRSFGPDKKNREAAEWAIGWETSMMQPGAAERLLTLKPKVSSRLEIHAVHAVENGEVVPRSFTLKVDHPFLLDCRVEGWTCALVALCDGSKTVAELCEHSKAASWIHPDTPPQEFAKFLAMLIGGGFLETEEARMPAAAG